MEDLGFAMPYGVTVEGDGSWYPKIVGNHPHKATGTRLNLIPGPCRVAFSWAGEAAAELVLVNGDDTKRPARLAEKRGGVHAQRWSSSAPAGAIRSNSMRGASVAKPALSRCIRSIFWSSTPAQGGGVSDCTTGNGLDALAGAEARIVGEQRGSRNRRGQGQQGHRDHVLAPRRWASADHRFQRGPLDVPLSQKPQAVWYGRPSQWANGPRSDGRTRPNRDVRVHRNPGYAAPCGCDDFPSPRLTTTSTGGGGR